MGGGLGRTLRKWFWFGCGATGIGTLLILLLSSGWLGFRLFQLEWKPQGKTDLAFREVALDFTNATDISEKTGSLPFLAGVASGFPTMTGGACRPGGSCSARPRMTARRSSQSRRAT